MESEDIWIKNNGERGFFVRKNRDFYYVFSTIVSDDGSRPALELICSSIEEAKEIIKKWI